MGISPKIRVDIQKQDDMLEYPTRTLKQNNAFHKWLRLLAAALNDAGYTLNDYGYMGRVADVVRRGLPESWADTLLKALGHSVQDGSLIRVPVLYTMENLKENVVHPMMQHLYPDVKTSKRLNTEQMSFLYKHIDQVVSERTGVHVEFPHDETSETE
jgi:hypothetical protein